MPNKKLPIRTLITAVIVLSVTIYTFIGCWKGLSRTYIEDDWKATKGKILGDDAVIEGKKNIARKTEGIEQAINYEYEIDGVKYKSNAVSKEVFVITTDYPEGTVVDVYYNPENVRDSVLVRSRVQKQYIVAVMVFCFVLAAVVVFCTIRDLK